MLNSQNKKDHSNSTNLKTVYPINNLKKKLFVKVNRNFFLITLKKQIG